MHRHRFALAASALALWVLAGCGSPAPSQIFSNPPVAAVPPVIAPPPPPAPVRVEAPPQAPSALAGFESDIGGAAAESGLKLEMAADGKLLLRAAADAAFAPSSTSPTPRYAGFLKQLASRLAQHQSLNVRITGHTDATGNARRNDKLSEGRAQVTARALTQNGIAAFRIDADGRGQREPIAGNDTAAGRAANRRIDIVITDSR